MVEPLFDRRERRQGSSGAAAAGLDFRADEELLRLYRDSRGAEAFTEMVRRHQPMVLRTCLRLAGNLNDAEDAAQNVAIPECVRGACARPPKLDTRQHRPYLAKGGQS